MGSWTHFSQGCPALFLCPSTLVFSLCYSGYELHVMLVMSVTWEFGFEELYSVCVEWTWETGEADDVVDGVLWLSWQLHKGMCCFCSLVFNVLIQSWIRPFVILNACGICCDSTGCGFSSKTCFSTCQENNCHKRWGRECVRIWIAFFSHAQHSLLIWVFIILCFYLLLFLCHSIIFRGMSLE